MRRTVAGLPIILVLVLPALAFASNRPILPMNPPTADLANWKDACYNCFNYGVNLKTQPRAQIVPDPNNCADIVAAVAVNGLVFKGNPNGPVPACGADSCIVYCCIAVDKNNDLEDFHWIRRNADGSWSQKHGTDDAKGTDDTGGNMTDAVNPPHKAVADGKIKIDGLKYTVSCGYFCFKNPTLAANKAGETWQRENGSSKVQKFEFSGVPDPSSRIFNPSLLLSHLPSGIVTSPYTGSWFGGYGIMPDASLGGLPPYIKVHNGVVAYYNDLAGTSVTYYVDDHGLETYLGTRTYPAPALNVVGMIALGVLLMGGGAWMYRRRVDPAFGA